MLPSNFKFIQRGWFNGNSILILGKGGPAIVDSGHLLYRAETLAKVREAGVAPETLRLIVTTHCHSDHHGANRPLKEMSGAPIAMGEMTAAWFAEGERYLTWFDQVSQEVDIVPADIVLHEGDRLKLAEMEFEVLHLPGHAPDSIGLYQPDTRVMICADAMWENDVGVLNTPIHPNALDAAEATIQKLMGYDIAIAIPGHGGLITDVPANLEAVARKLARFRAEPAFLVQHYVRRMLMYAVLRFQPVARPVLIKQAQEGFGLQRYLDYYAAYLPQTDAAVWAAEALDAFAAAGLVVEVDGLLRSVVPT